MIGVVFGLLVVAQPALGFEPEPTLELETAVSYFTVGARVNMTSGLKQPLWNEEDSLLFEDTWLSLQAITNISPSYVRIGPQLSFSPLAMLEASAHYVVSPYFGTFSSLIGFDDPAAVYDPHTLDALAAEGERHPGFVTRYGADLTLKAKAGPVAALFISEWARWKLVDNDIVMKPYYYEPESKLLLSKTDTTVSNDALLLVDVPLLDAQKELFVGLMGSQSRALVSEDVRRSIGPIFILNTKGGRTQHLLLVQAMIDDRVMDQVFPPYIAIRSRYTLL